jgi:hypothetical protein
MQHGHLESAERFTKGSNFGNELLAAPIAESDKKANAVDAGSTTAHEAQPHIPARAPGSTADQTEGTHSPNRAPSPRA